MVHGEHASNPFTEIYCFSRWYWSRMFRNTGWVIKKVKPIGIFYTGSSIFDSHLSLGVRRKLSLFFGSACNIYILRNEDNAEGA